MLAVWQLYIICTALLWMSWMNDRSIWRDSWLSIYKKINCVLEAWAVFLDMENTLIIYQAELCGVPSNDVLLKCWENWPSIETCDWSKHGLSLLILTNLHRYFQTKIWFLRNDVKQTRHFLKIALSIISRSEPKAITVRTRNQETVI